jgi:hypothetical protein
LLQLGLSPSTTWNDVENEVFQNGMLRIIFGLERTEVTGERRKLYNEELQYTQSSPAVGWGFKSKST